MSLKRVVEEASSLGRVKPNFTKYHVLKALITIYLEEPIGRLLLSKLLNLGEASTRTLIKRLRSLGVLRVDPIGGCMLSDEGRSLLEDFFSKIEIIGYVNEYVRGKLKLSTYSYAVILKSACEKLVPKEVTHIRDLIVRNGGLGALILCFKDGKLYMPGPGRIVGEEELEELRILRSKLRSLKSGDLVLISFCEDPVECEASIVNSILELYWA